MKGRLRTIEVWLEPVKSDTIAYPCFTPVLEFTYQRKSEKEMKGLWKGNVS